MLVIKESSPQGYDATPPLVGDPALAAALTPLIGRVEDTDRVGRLLRDRVARLLVLTGPGGVGKTRLAMAVARSVIEAFPDGVVLISLASMQAAEQVLTTIAAALNVHETSRASIAAAIHQALRGRRMLLVLDNFEQVIDAAPDLTDLLTQTPELSILVTSRSVLGVYGEFVYPVPPMGVPAETDRSMERIAASDAVQLFINRVRAFRPDFRLTARNAADVAAICARLDGLPLAIELAAARTSIFTVSSLAQRLEHLLPVLEGGPRDVPDRLRTMRNAISWSYALLTPREQAVFRRLSIFLGSWSFEAAEAVAIDPADGLDLDELELVSLVASLVDKSLVQRLDTADSDRHFTILQTLREFGLIELEAAGERAATEERHAHHMLAFAKRAQPHLVGRDQVFWLNQIELMRPDLRLAFSWLITNNRPTEALRLATSLWRFGYTRGHILETRSRLEEALARVPERSPLRARALNGAGVLSNVAGDHDLTRAYHQEALDIGQELGRPRIMAVALLGLGDSAWISKDVAQAQRCYEEAERLYTRLDDQRGIATAQTNLGNLFWSLGKHDEAVQSHEAAKRLYAAAGDQRGTAWSVTNIGRIAGETGHYRRACSNLSQAMELYELLADRSGIAETLEGFALIAISTGDATRAATLLGAADALRGEITHPVPNTERAAFDRLLTSVRDALDRTFEDAWNAGQRMPLDDAIGLALAITAPPDASPQPRVAQDASTAAIARLGITERELEVLQRLGTGESDKQIAEQMFISPRTVQSHVQSLLNKLEVSSRSAAVARAFRAGILH